MCIGIPMQVQRCEGNLATCLRDGQAQEIDMSLVGEHPPGTWVLTFLGCAREVLSAADAQRIDQALEALGAVMAGQSQIDHLFADLVDREPPLPEHLRRLVKP